MNPIQATPAGRMTIRLAQGHCNETAVIVTADPSFFLSLALDLFFVFLVIQIKKNDAVVWDGATVQPFVFLETPFTPVIYQTVIPAAHIFFEPAVVKPLHFSI